MTIMSLLAAALIAASQPAGSGEPVQGVAAPTRPAQTEVIESCADCPKMIAVPVPGSGSGRLYVSIYELTWRNYLAAYVDGRCPFPTVYLKPRGVSDAHAAKYLAIDWPVERIPLSGINCYIKWLNDRSDLEYRLPTSAEWEYFARAGATSRFPWGESLGHNNASLLGRYDQNVVARAPALMSLDRYYEHNKVGQFAPNNFGIYDVIGNAAELTQTCADDPPATPSLTKDPSKQCRLVLRGGDQNWAPDDLGLSKYRLVESTSDLGPAGIRLVAE